MIVKTDRANSLPPKPPHSHDHDDHDNNNVGHEHDDDGDNDNAHDDEHAHDDNDHDEDVDDEDDADKDQHGIVFYKCPAKEACWADHDCNDDTDDVEVDHDDDALKDQNKGLLLYTCPVAEVCWLLFDLVLRVPRVAPVSQVPPLSLGCIEQNQHLNISNKKSKFEFLIKQHFTQMDEKEALVENRLMGYPVGHMITIVGLENLLMVDHVLNTKYVEV